MPERVDSGAPTGVSASSAGARLDAWLGAQRTEFEAQLESFLPAPPECPAPLFEALRYTLLSGGKRLRPALVALLCEGLGGTRADALAPGAAIEMLHTYSLVHDDLPCMDDDALRRGQPTCHVVYGEALATLAGDALQTLAFETLAQAGLRAADQVSVLARAAGAVGMVGGQVLDMDPAARLAGTDGIRDVHARKTAALFGAAAELGALAADAEDGEQESARAFGLALGLLFQATDDVLDVTADVETLGKTPGKDARLDRDSLVASLGLEGAIAEADQRAAEARAAAAALPWASNAFDGGGLATALVARISSRRR